MHLALLIAFVDRALTCLCVTLRFSGERRPGRLRWRILFYASINLYGLVRNFNIRPPQKPKEMTFTLGIRLVGHVQLHQ